MTKSRKFAAIIFITIVLSFYNFLSYAQLVEQEQGYFLQKPRLFYAGLVCGINFTQVDGDNFAGYYKTGANFGGIGYINLPKNLAISWEFLYSQKGSKSNIVRQAGIDSIYITNYGIKVNYAEIPVMINLFDKFKSHFGIGVSYNRLVSYSEVLATYPRYNIDLNKYPFKTDEWEFLAAANLHVWKGLFFNIRFQYSLVPMRTQIPPEFSRALQYNNLWTVRLMYLFM